MKSEYVAVLRGDPVLLNRITPVVDQRRHLWQRLNVILEEMAGKKSTLKQKMPKIDTLDALDDEMTSILNTL